MLRIALIAFSVYGCWHLMAGEWFYARGMASAVPQTSIDRLTSAGEAYPASFTFRRAQPLQLFMLAARSDDLATVRIAAEAMRRAVAVDPSSADLVSKLLAMERMTGQCDAARSTADRLLALAPRSDKAKRLASLPCEPRE